MAIKFLNTVAVDNDVLYVDASANKVGIGTDSPDAKLEVYKLHATEGASLMLTSKDTGIGSPPFSEIQFKTSRTDSTNLLQAGRVISGWDGISYTTSRITLQNANGVDTWIDTLTAKNGNVGIGTTSPGAKLHVIGSGENGGIIFNNSGAQEHRLYTSANSQFNTIGSNTPIWHWAQYTGVGVSPNYKMTLNNTGLGIGTIAPAAKLHVKESSGSTSQIKMSAASNEANYGYLTMLDNTANTAKLTFGTTYGYSTQVDAMTVWNGMVGIGTDSPSNKFVVRGLSSSGNSSADNVAQFEGPSGTNGFQVFVNDTNNNTGIQTKNGDDFLINPLGGNVGIGTPSPGAKLEVAGGSTGIRLSNLGDSGAYDSIEMTYNGYNSGTPEMKFRPTQTPGSGIVNSYFRFINSNGSSTTANNHANVTIEGNVGIGTPSPDHILCIEDTEPTLRIFDSANTLNQEQTISFGTEPGNRTHAEISGINLNAGNSAGGLIFKTNTGSSLIERMRISSAGAIKFNAYGAGTLVTDASGNITAVGGGGAGGPFLPLSAGSGFPLTGDLWLDDNSGASPSLYLQNGSNNYWRLLNGSTGIFSLKEGTSDRITILPGGNVGIDYPSPAGKLSVDGNVTIGTNVVRERLTVGGKVYIEQQGVDWNETTPGKAIGTQHFDPAGNGAADTGNAITFGASDTSSGATAQAGIYTRSDGAYGTKMYFATTNSYALGSKTRMMIDYNGNVGIGTTGPDAKLEVDVASGDGILINSADVATFKMKGGGVANWGFATTNLASGDFGIYKSNASGGDPISAGTPQLYIKSSGNVGIGTTSSDRRLVLDGTLGTAALEIKKNTDRIVYLGTGSSASADDNAILHLMDQNVVKINLNTVGDSYLNGGDVGIGTSGPDARLDVHNINGGNATTRAEMKAEAVLKLRPHATNSTNMLFSQVNSGGGMGITVTNGPATANWDIALNPYGGNVGIGTDSPNANLEVSRATNGIYFEAGVDGRGLRFIASSGATFLGAEHRIDAPSAQGVLKFSITDDEKMRIDTNGNVGIGTNAPAARLHVKEPSGSTSQIKMSAASNEANYGYLTMLDNTYNTAKLTFGTTYGYNTPVDAMTIFNGNVGIGTSIPVRDFVVSNGGASGIEIQANYQAGVNEILSFDRTVGATAYETMRFNGGDFEFQTGGSERMRITSDGSLKVPSVHGQTTAISANVVVLSDGELLRSTSSLKYKTDVRNYDKGLNEVMQLQPKYYKGKNDGETIFAGLIAEDVHDLGLTEFVQYAEDGTPDSLAYSHMIALLAKSIQELKAEIDILKAK